MTGIQNDLLEMTADIVSAYVTKNVVTAENLPDVITSVHAALSKVSTQGLEEPKVELKPAVPVKKSVNPDFIICLEDGKKFKSLKRHLQSLYGLTPEEYREKWGLPRDYPMVAPAYAAARSDLAKNVGLGRRNGSAVSKKKPKVAAKASRKSGIPPDTEENGWLARQAHNLRSSSGRSCCTYGPRVSSETTQPTAIGRTHQIGRVPVQRGYCEHPQNGLPERLPRRAVRRTIGL